MELDETCLELVDKERRTYQNLLKIAKTCQKPPFGVELDDINDRCQNLNKYINI